MNPKPYCSLGCVSNPSHKSQIDLAVITNYMHLDVQDADRYIPHSM